MVNDETIQKAREHIESGDCKSALEILQPLIEKNEAAALFLYSTFSISSDETVEEFERRSIKCLQTASEMGYAPAIYALGVCYDFGDMVEHDSGKAALLFQKSAQLGYPKAKLSHGLNLYYGSNGINEDKTQALSLICQAANDGVEGASDFTVDSKDGNLH